MTPNIPQLLSSSCGQCTKSHTLIDLYTITDDRCLSNYHTSTMVDKEIFSNGCSRMDVNTCDAMGIFGHDTRDQRHFQQEQLMSQTIDGNRKHTRIRQDDLISVFCSRVSLKSCLQIGLQHSTDIWNLLQERNRIFFCLFG